MNDIPIKLAALIAAGVLMVGGVFIGSRIGNFLIGIALGTLWVVWSIA
jgi:hypothetical protein